MKKLFYILVVLTFSNSTFAQQKLSTPNKPNPVSIIQTDSVQAKSSVKAAEIAFISLSKFINNGQDIDNTSIKDGAKIYNTDQTQCIFFDLKAPDYNYEVRLRYLNDQTIKRMPSTWRLYPDRRGIRFTIYDQYFKKPGQYEVIITPINGIDKAAAKSHQAKFSFTVLANENKLLSGKEIAIIGIIVCAIFGAILGGSITYIKRRAQRRLDVEQQQKELAKSQLATVRSQLNPHFMFNALAGIQNLMNHHKIDEANRYLSKFARLTRNVLNQKELISLAEEKIMLEDYLQMEQLRFGFAYQINVAADLNLDNIEIPTMLLQPFVENAVKHGIAEKLEDGKIEVSFIQQNDNLVLQITDNGKGFDVAKNYEGLGLQLSKNRVALLNAIYPTTPVVLAITTEQMKTKITLTLTHWL